MTLDPNLLVTLSLLCAQEAKRTRIPISFTNPSGSRPYAKANAYRAAWAQVDDAGCREHCAIQIDGFWCSICSLPQVLTYRGLTCDNGHGGANSLRAPRKHQWADNPADPAGYVCSVCGAGDLDEKAKAPCSSM